MTIHEIRQMPTKMIAQEFQEQRGKGKKTCSPWEFRETDFRAFHTLAKVKQLLAIKTPPEIILEIIAEIERMERDFPHPIDFSLPFPDSSMEMDYQLSRKIASDQGHDPSREEWSRARYGKSRNELAEKMGAVFAENNSALAALQKAQ